MSAAAAKPSQHGLASLIAGLTAAVVLIVAVIMLIMVRAPHRDNHGHKDTSTTTTTAIAGKPSQTVTATTTETTLEAPDRSLLGRALGLGASPILFQLLLAGAVAFAVGAMVQRVILGEYGVTVGPVSLPTLPPVTEDDTREALDRITKAPEIANILLTGQQHPQAPPLYMQVDDPRLGLMSIRVDLETKLRKLSEAVGIDRDVPVERLPRRLKEDGQFTSAVARGVEELLRISDRIVDGAVVEDDAAAELRAQAGEVLYAIDELGTRAAVPSGAADGVAE